MGLVPSIALYFKYLDCLMFSQPKGIFNAANAALPMCRNDLRNEPHAKNIVPTRMRLRVNSKESYVILPPVLFLAEFGQQGR